MSKTNTDNNQVAPHHYSAAIVVVLVAIAVLIGAALFLWQDNKTSSVGTTSTTQQVTNSSSNSTTNSTTNSTATNTTATNTTTTNTTKTSEEVTALLGSDKYVDSKFGFSITLPSSWNSFFAVDSPDSAPNFGAGTLGIVSFYAETTSTVWPEVFNPSKSYHYGPVFYVHIYTKDAWDNSKKDITGPHGRLLGEKDGKVFTMITPQDTAPDLIGEYKKVDFDTFKAL